MKRGNKTVCKRRYPFDLSPEDVVLEDGTWQSKRLNPRLNSWCPAITLNLRCNNDIKLITNGPGTKSLSFYICKYAAKSQGKERNVAAVMTKTFMYHNQDPRGFTDLRERHRLLLFRLVHALNREQEIAGPMVMSYLMGWGDTYKSHKYEPLYWGSFVKELRKFDDTMGMQR